MEQDQPRYCNAAGVPELHKGMTLLDAIEAGYAELTVKGRNEVARLIAELKQQFGLLK